MRLTGCIKNGCTPRRKNCGHNNIFGGGNTGFIKQNISSFKILTTKGVIAVRPQGYTQLSQSVKMSIKAAAADNISPRRRNCNSTETGSHRPGKQN
jgi:hypothetical protein